MKRKTTKRAKILMCFMIVIIIVFGGLIIKSIYNIAINANGQEYIQRNYYNLENTYEKNGLKYYDDGEITSLAGIDVSTYQKNIDWQQVKDSGVDFAIIRAGYRTRVGGEIHIDDKFQSNIKNATSVGMDVGVYFFSQAISKREAREEARFAVNAVKGYDLSYPIVFDMEYVDGEDRIKVLTNEEKTDIAIAFCREVKRYGYKPMIYGNTNWLTGEVFLEDFDDYDLWLADYSENPEFIYKFKMWQYTHLGRVNGIKGNVDLNVLFIEKEKEER